MGKVLSHTSLTEINHHFIITSALVSYNYKKLIIMIIWTNLDKNHIFEE